MFFRNESPAATPLQAPDEEAMSEMAYRLQLEKARCHADYEHALKQMQQHYLTVRRMRRSYALQVQHFEPYVDRLLEGGILNSRTALAAVRYIQYLSRLNQCRLAETICFSAFLPPEEHALGAPIGTPTLKEETGKE